MVFVFFCLVCVMVLLGGVLLFCYFFIELVFLCGYCGGKCVVMGSWFGGDCFYLCVFCIYGLCIGYGYMVYVGGDGFICFVIVIVYVGMDYLVIGLGGCD